MFCQNDQIHINLYLTVGNTSEIGKVYQVIEKWVFFRLLFANPTDSSGGKNHNHKKYIFSKIALEKIRPDSVKKIFR